MSHRPTLPKLHVATLKVAANYFITYFHKDKAILFYNSVKIIGAIIFVLIHGQNNHPACLAKIAIQSVKSQGFVLSRWVATLYSD